MEKDPWYRDGLRFQCTGCGDCCTGAPGYVWVNKEEIAALAQSAGLSVEDFEKKYVRRVGVRKSLKEFPNGDCVFFNHETRRCQAYELRPRQCRTWPFWGSNIVTPEAWKATCRDCPGAGTGPVVSLEEIQASAAKIKI
jgi:hypothetical protein